MNTRQLEFFHAVMISGSASRASELLGVSQPAVSRAIAELEADIGFQLFDRVRGRLVPTPEGQLFFREVTANFIGLDRLRSSAARIRDFGSGSIRIASLAAMGSTLVPRALKVFRKKHPDIAITLQVLMSASVRELILNHQYDIGLVADEVDTAGLDHRLFATTRAFCAIPPRHRLAGRRIITAADLDGVPFIALAPEDRARARFEKALAAAGSNPQIVVETAYSVTVCALVLEGVGLGLVNPAAVDGFTERGLVLRPFEPAIQFKSYVLFRADAQRNQMVREFTQALMKARRALGSAFPER